MGKWNYWTERSYYHAELRDRAKGIKSEMEAAKQISQLIFNKAKSYNSILDAGCGTGHFILSLEKKLKDDFKYLGVDITEQHIIDATEIFKENKNFEFQLGDVRDLDVEDKSYEVSICSNTIPHIPQIGKAINELIRVTKNDVFIRMLVGDEVLITKKALSDKFDENGEPDSFMYINIYDKNYLNNIIGDKGELFIYDDEFDQDAIIKHYNEHKDIAGKNIATRIVEGNQFKGYLMLPWKIVHIKLY
ncbi:class I SAM-dependent methyltransferase [Flavobacterium sp. ASV13]|uniref:class I SAM-dependent methyltransferase n=1 Tax=Flavobacterium sp. ASV13 TaxID=1506583 RepID=UPI00054CF6FE|nr:class I SAM-dependent methyltransferase [Flavobacterium sp. ASV13]